MNHYYTKLKCLPDCLGMITCVTLKELFANFPANTPQVSIFLAVFFSASDKNLADRVDGTNTFLKPDCELNVELGLEQRSGMLGCLADLELSGLLDLR